MTTRTAANTPGETPLEVLDRRAAEGSPAALGELLRRLEPRLHHTVYRIVGRRQETADVLQDAFVKAVERFGGYEGRSSLTTWVTRIVINQSFDHLRQDRRQREHRERYQAANELRPEPEAGPLEQVEQRDAHERVAATLLAMPPEFKAVLALRDVGGFAYDEIATVLQLPVGTVKSRLFRARLMLRERLRSEDGGENRLAAVSAEATPATGGGAS